jgi:hypothetical protein
MSSTAVWKVPSTVDPRALGEARHQAQNVAHWLVRMANSYIDAEPGHRHVTLNWDPARNALVTRPFANGYAVELRLPDLELQFRENDKLSPHILNVEGHTPAHVEAWMLVELLHRGLDRDRFSKELPYQVEDLMAGDHEEFSPETVAKELAALTDWLSSGHAVLSELAQKHGASGAALQFWPDQFQIGFQIPVAGAAGETTVRVAMSAGDNRHAEPYFLVAAQNGSGLETPRPGATLPASRILAENMTAEAVAAHLDGLISSTKRRFAH